MNASSQTTWLMAIVMVSSAAILLVLRDDAGPQETGTTSEIQKTVEWVAPTESKVPIPRKKIEKLEIDVAGRRVLLPGDGWISAQAFWDIYYNHPEKLPGEIDFARLLKLEALTETERILAEDISDPLQQAVGRVDDTLDPALPRSSQ